MHPHEQQAGRQAGRYEGAHITHLVYRVSARHHVDGLDRLEEELEAHGAVLVHRVLNAHMAAWHRAGLYNQLTLVQP